MDINKENPPSTALNLSPDYGATFSFDSDNKTFSKGDNYMSYMPKGINSLKMTANLKFSELTDNEAHDAIEFLQSKYYYNVQNYNQAGNFDNQKITGFYFKEGVSSPYKEDLRYLCTKFNHTKNFYNSNQISASFTTIGASITESVQPNVGYDPRIFHGNFSFSSETPSDTPNTVSANFSIPSPYNTYNTSIDIKKGQHIFESGSYRSVVPQSNSTISAGGSLTTSSLSRFGMGASNAIVARDGTRASIFIDQNIVNANHEYPYAPIQSNPGGGNNTLIQNVKYKMFDHYPSYTWSIEHSPKYKMSNVLDVYQKYSLYGFNPNLNNISLEFSTRSDKEANRILLFLESHLGYRKFGFHLPNNYGNSALSSSNFSSPHRKTFSTFICPDWSHTILYKNNHTINANFIECVPH